MLKIKISSEMKESIILLIFSLLMRETLTGATIILAIFGATMVWLKKRPTRLIRNVISLVLFAVYWVTFGKVIDPEVGMNFLTSIVVLKLLEKETQRDRYMIFFGIILLVSAGSLFVRNLTYVFFFGVSFFILIQDFYKNLKLKAKVTDLLKSLAWVLPFTALLFFFVPRLPNPLQIQKGTPKQGEIGYTPEVNISQLESLSFNDSPVFQASVDREIANQKLYWRGNVLTFSDGWNWPLMPQDRYQKPFIPSQNRVNPIGLKQIIRVLSQQDFYFGLDHPILFNNQKGSASLDSSRTLFQNQWQPSLRYEVRSQFTDIGSDDVVEFARFKTGLKNEEKKWIQENFHSTKLPELQKEIQAYFQREAFSYSLSPGRVENFLSFMRKNKVGFCSHYASALALILRAKKIPSRLVSGFMGGSYNNYARFYQVTQNDAHVWVEAFYLGKWQRLDPTAWIAPDRIRLGGDAFMQQSNPGALSQINIFGKKIKFFNQWQQWFSQWDFKFYQWLEEMDYYGQGNLFDKLHFKREWIFSVIPLVLALFMGLYLWHLTLKRTKKSEIESLWLKFQDKMHRRGLHFQFDSLAKGEACIKKQEPLVQDIWKELVEISFKAEPQIPIKILKKKINKL